MAVLNPALRALAFLTRFPSPASAFAGGPHPLHRDVVAFPVVGVVAALPAALVCLALPALGISPLASAVFAVAALVLATGALHEDGLGDVADGLFGHLPRERAIEVMKDSRVGTYGASALILSLIARIALVGELIDVSPAIAGLALLGTAALSRSLMVVLWSSLPAADIGGLAHRMGRPTRRRARLCAALGCGIFLACAAALGPAPLVAAAILAGTTGLAFRRWLEWRLGGQTGDTLGAAQQLTEIALLLGLCAG